RAIEREGRRRSARDRARGTRIRPRPRLGAKTPARKRGAVKPDRYAKSRAMLERAQRVIPLGSQTFSKSRVVYPANAAPLFLTHGKGAHVWDVDGNEYVDFVNGLLPVILGYDDPDVIEAVSAQLKRGVTFSLATE